MFSFNKLPVQKTHSLAPSILLLMAVVCFFLDEILSDYFVYHREFIIEHQYWRLITGHIFHTNVMHLLLNTSALVLLWAIHGQFYTNTSYVLLLLFSAVIISFAIFVFDPQMTQYVGLSGVLHALFVWGALKDIEHKDKTGYLLLLGVILKVGYEQLFGASTEVAELIEANVAIDAHLWGVISGVVFFKLQQRLKATKAVNNNQA